MIREGWKWWTLVLAVTAGAFLLVGCAQKPRIVTVTQEVRVPVPVACITPDMRPTTPSGLGNMPSDANTALSRALAKVIEWTAYGKATEAVLDACSAP